MSGRFHTALVLGAMSLVGVGACSSGNSSVDAGRTTTDAGARDAGAKDAGPSCPGGVTDPATRACEANPCDAGGIYNPFTGQCTFSPTIALTDFQQAYLQAWCDYRARCGLEQIEQGACVEEWSARADEFDFVGLRVSQAQAGVVTYDEGQGGLCVNALETLDCNTTLLRPFDPAPCQAAFTGTEATSFACSTSAQCDTGLFCLPPAAGSANPCSGSCQAVGERCVTNADCNTGDSCLAGQECEPQTRPPGEVGEPCGDNDACAQDEVNQMTHMVVAEGCFAQSGSQTGVCQQLSTTAGSPCDEDGHCAPGFLCTTAPNSTTLGCFPKEVANHQGFSCSVGNLLFACGLTSAGVLLTCDPPVQTTAGTCEPTRKSGDACSDVFDCGGPISALYCDVTSGKCAARPSTGPCPQDSSGNVAGYPGSDACDPGSSWCASVTGADGGIISGTCTPFKSGGAACDRPEECGPWYLNPTCAPTGNSPTPVCAVLPDVLCQ